MERLERRALLASNITATLLADGTLQVEGTAAYDYVVNDDGQDWLDGVKGLTAEDERHLYALHADHGLFLSIPPGPESLFAKNVQSFAVSEQGISLFLLDLAGQLAVYPTGIPTVSSPLATNVQSFTVGEDGHTLTVTYRDQTTAVLLLDDHGNHVTLNDSTEGLEPRTAQSRSTDQTDALIEYAGSDEFLSLWNDV